MNTFSMLFFIKRTKLLNNGEAPISMPGSPPPLPVQSSTKNFICIQILSYFDGWANIATGKSEKRIISLFIFFSETKFKNKQKKQEDVR